MESNTDGMERAEFLAAIDPEVERALQNAPSDPIERLFWFEHCLRVAAKRYQDNKSQANECLLRRAAVLYAEAERAVRGCAVPK